MDLLAKYLHNNLYMNIATVDSNGQPWNTPVFFAHRDKKLHWFSRSNSVHSTNIASNPKVFITMYDSTLQEGEGAGLYLLAKAYVLQDQTDLRAGIDVYNEKAKQYKISEEFLSPSAPNKLYCSEVEQAWVNDSGSSKGDYVDVRTELKL